MAIALPDVQTVLDANAADLIASGNTQGLRELLKAEAGNVGATTLAVPYTFYETSEGPSLNHKVQLGSCADGNVVFVYASGADLNANNPQYGPIFMKFGQIVVIPNIQAGTIITSTEGAYGFAQQRRGNDESPMPLMSFALAEKLTFAYAFRSSSTYDPGGTSQNQGFIHIVGGPNPTTVTLTRGGNVVRGQQDIEIGAWEYKRLFTDANGEYLITSGKRVMHAINANMSATAPRFYDSRLVLPPVNDLIAPPRSGFVSAPYNGTVVVNYVNDKTSTGPSVTDTFTVSPGVPVDWDSSTGAFDADYEPKGATRAKASGLITAFSGADSAGLEACPGCPVKFMSYVIPVPMYIRNSGDGGNNGIAIMGPFTGQARIYQWNQITEETELYSFLDPSGNPTDIIQLHRRDGDTPFTATTRAQQNHPASALLSPQGAGGTDPNSYDMTGDFAGGIIVSNVPVAVFFNSKQNENGSITRTFSDVNGILTPGIHSDDDEQLSFGISPEFLKAEIKEAEDGLLYRRVLGAGGVESWVVA